MNRTRLRLAGFGLALAVLFGGGYAVGAQFPVDDSPPPDMEHPQTDHESADQDHEASP
jgi:hypothetical protein